MTSASFSPRQVHDSLGDEMCHTEADHRHPRRLPQLSFQPQHHRCIFTFFVAIPLLLECSFSNTWRFHRTVEFLMWRDPRQRVAHTTPGMSSRSSYSCLGLCRLRFQSSLRQHLGAHTERHQRTSPQKALCGRNDISSWMSLSFAKEDRVCCAPELRRPPYAS
jgi:hypothetical protein